MSSENNEIAKAIREQTAYFKSVIDTIKMILIVCLITIIGIYGFIILAGIVTNYLNQGHETTTVAAPMYTQNNIISENMSKKIDEYRFWCMDNNKIWSTLYDGNLPYCMNQYGEKIHP